MPNLLTKTKKILKITENRHNLLKDVFNNKISWFKKLDEQNKSEIIQRLATAIDYLSPKQRRIIMLKYGFHSTDTFEFDEISQLENYTLDEVKSLYKKAFEQFSKKEIQDKIKYGKHTVGTIPMVDEISKDFTLEEVNYSSRTYNTLKRAGIDLVEEIVKIYEKSGNDGILKIRGIDKKGLEEILESFRRINDYEMSIK